jgi:GntR family transcriptional repressor for pyruvate dehydrogenase complex
VNSRGRNHVRQPRLADMVAATLRDEILTGRLGEGDEVPRQEDLLEEFDVSPPVIREALRILETEGLITVRRGNVGGAVVHVPESSGVAYMVSLVLQLKHASLKDVGAALREMEPICVAMCARRKDRKTKVVPILESLVALEAKTVGKTDEDNQVWRQFHEALVSCCGNETMILVVGALETLWSAHEQRAAEEFDTPSEELWQGALEDHEKILEAIRSGDSDEAHRLAQEHLALSQEMTVSRQAPKEVVANLIRASVQR